MRMKEKKPYMTQLSAKESGEGEKERKEERKSDGWKERMRMRMLIHVHEYLFPEIMCSYFMSK